MSIALCIELQKALEIAIINPCKICFKNECFFLVFNAKPSDFLTAVQALASEHMNADHVCLWFQCGNLFTIHKQDIQPLFESVGHC